MTVEELLMPLRRKPFQPLRIVMTDGTTYLIRHPDQVFPMTISAIVSYPNPRDQTTAAYDMIALGQIVRLELPEGLPAQGPDVRKPGEQPPPAEPDPE